MPAAKLPIPIVVMSLPVNIIQVPMGRLLVLSSTTLCISAQSLLSSTLYLSNTTSGLLTVLPHHWLHCSSIWLQFYGTRRPNCLALRSWIANGRSRAAGLRSSCFSNNLPPTDSKQPLLQHTPSSTKSSNRY